MSISQIFHSDFTEKQSETQRPLFWEIGTMWPPPKKKKKKKQKQKNNRV